MKTCLTLCVMTLHVCMFFLWPTVQNSKMITLNVIRQRKAVKLKCLKCFAYKRLNYSNMVLFHANWHINWSINHLSHTPTRKYNNNEADSKILQNIKNEWNSIIEGLHANSPSAEWSRCKQLLSVKAPEEEIRYLFTSEVMFLMVTIKVLILYAKLHGRTQQKKRNNKNSGYGYEDSWILTCRLIKAIITTSRLEYE